jgi:hypothetical protein
MGKNAQRRRQQRAMRQASAAATWVAPDGVHAVLPGTPPSAEQLEELTKAYQQQIRNSPLWAEMVREFGAAKAEELLKECRAKLA